MLAKGGRDMDWLTLGATAAFGFAAAQGGAWLQHRRDAKTQRARDVAENERLSAQLESQSQEAELNRGAADVIDWRERRIAAYGAVSLAASRVADLAERTAGVHDVWSPTSEPLPSDVEEARRDLQMTLNDASLISEAHLREVGEHLWMVGRPLNSYARRFKEAGDACGEAVPSDRATPLDVANFFGPLTPERAKEELDKTEEQWRDMKQNFDGWRERWAEDCRAYLGVPD